MSAQRLSVLFPFRKFFPVANLIFKCFAWLVGPELILPRHAKILVALDSFFPILSIFSVFSLVSQVMPSSASPLFQKSVNHKLFLKFKELKGHVFFFTLKC